ncbi:MAG: BfmA/BtgA family mobilization protein [Lachnospiraceae bacterium]|jgi:hypothetical protein|nr:BfmA/BtgA family mobilization protein [Lachnospiraceae bacterium]
MMEKYSNLKINPDLKKRLDKLRKGKTFNAIIDEMLTYFEMTGVNPKSDITPPVATFVKVLNQQGEAIMDRLTSVIKIIRNIEANKIDALLEGIAGDISQNSSSIPDSEILQVIETNKSLKDKLANKEEEIARLKKDNGKDLSKTKNIIDTIEQYLKNPSLPRDSKGNILVSDIYIKNLLDKIRNV